MMTSTAQQYPPIILTVAGSDPTAGAGLQADLKTITHLGGYATTAVTAITIQDTQQVHQVYPLPPHQVAEQMRTCLADLPVACIKLGMLANKEILLTVANILRAWPRIPVVADPVLAGSKGGTLLDHNGLQPYLEILLPQLTLLTPNLPETTTLTGLPVHSLPEREQAARQLAQGNQTAILIKGGHGEGEQLTDLLLNKGKIYLFSNPRLPGPGFHGTGCTLASAISVYLAQGNTIEEAVKKGLLFVQQAIANSLPLGKGQHLLNPIPLHTS
ncbi:MAG: bifunctional hydroxymethylpyrimidine kinase/phosphomethylpyrimidine kinase [Magnetococcus sp. YQC-3]